jgi:hypothetical protein
VGQGITSRALLALPFKLIDIMPLFPPPNLSQAVKAKANPITVIKTIIPTIPWIALTIFFTMNLP